MADVYHDGANCVHFTAPDGSYEIITLTDHELHSYIPWSAFVRAQNSTAQFSRMNSGGLSFMLVKSIKDCSWQTIKHTVHNLHRHVCGYSPYSDTKLILDRAELSNDDVERFLSRTVEQCLEFRRKFRP